MARYYYDKYSIKLQYYNFRNLGNWTPIERVNVGQTTWSGYKSYNHGSDIGFEGNPNEYVSYTNLSPEVIGKVLYKVQGIGQGILERKFIERDSSNNMIVDERRRAYQDYDSRQVLGDLIETIQADEGTYPDNGIQGNFWYIKRGKVFPEFKVKIDGEIRTAESGWVKVDGQLKEIDRMWTKIDGVIKEI